MRRQDGSAGWRRAHDSELINGCAAEVIGDMEARVDGRVWELGNRMGEMKGLSQLADAWLWPVHKPTDSSSVPSQPNYRRYRIVLAMEDVLGNQWDDVGCIEANSGVSSLQKTAKVSINESYHITPRIRTAGKQSLSNTKVCSNWPNANGISNQLPHHHGLSHALPLFPHIHPSSSARLYVTSAARLRTYMAIVILS